MDNTIKRYLDAFGTFPDLPIMASLEDANVLRLMDKAIKRGKELTFDEVCEGIAGKYDVVE